MILIPGASQPKLMEKAASLYRQGLAPCILPSGGATPRVETTEWEFLQNVGLDQGVPEQAILKEDKARILFKMHVFRWRF